MKSESSICFRFLQFSHYYRARRLTIRGKLRAASAQCFDKIARACTRAVMFTSARNSGPPSITSAVITARIINNTKRPQSLTLTGPASQRLFSHFGGITLSPSHHCACSRAMKIERSKLIVFRAGAVDGINWLPPPRLGSAHWISLLLHCAAGQKNFMAIDAARARHFVDGDRCHSVSRLFMRFAGNFGFIVIPVELVSRQIYSTTNSKN